MKIIFDIDNYNLKQYMALLVEVKYDAKLVLPVDRDEFWKELLGDEACVVITEFTKDSKEIYDEINQKSESSSFVMVAEKPFSELPGFSQVQEVEGKRMRLPLSFSEADLYEGLDVCFYNQRVSQDSLKRKNTLLKFEKIKIERLLKADFKSPTDIFIRLGEVKFVKIINAGGGIDQASLKNYSEKKVEHLYVPVREFKNVLAAFRASFGLEVSAAPGGQREVEREKPRSEKELKVEAEETISIIETTKELGVTEETVKHVDALAENCLKDLRKDVNFFKKVNKVFSSQTFVADHSRLIAYIASDICHKLGWIEDSIQKKMVFSALMHDFVFIDSPELARFQTKGEIQDMEPAEQKLVLDHPIKVSTEVMNSKIRIPDVGKIILEHHERPDGTGFPKGLQASFISPLGCLFIMAEDLCLRTFNKVITKKLLADISSDFQKTYDTGNFKQFLPAFQQLLETM